MMINLEKNLGKYDKIFLFIGKDEIFKEFIEYLYVSQAFRFNAEKVLILSTGAVTGGKNCVCRRLSWEEAVQLKELYLLYEFSDRFELFSWEDNFGSIVNYIESGVLTWEEAFAAILY